MAASCNVPWFPFSARMKSPPPSMIFSAMAVCVPIASMVMMAPWISTSDNK